MGVERSQRLPDGDPADAEMLREPSGVQSLSWPEDPLDDCFLENLVELIAKCARPAQDR
jgi:hypothetical protein